MGSGGSRLWDGGCPLEPFPHVSECPKKGAEHGGREIVHEDSSNGPEQQCHQPRKLSPAPDQVGHPQAGKLSPPAKTHPNHPRDALSQCGWMRGSAKYCPWLIY